MASYLDSNDSAMKKRARQDSSDPETSCQKCDSLISEKIMCQGCKLDYCLKCAGISHELFVHLTKGEMEDFLWSCKSCRATFPSLDNITKYLKESLSKNDVRMTKLESRMKKLETSNILTNKTVSDMKVEICNSVKEDINKLVDARNSELEDTGVEERLTLHCLTCVNIISPQARAIRQLMLKILHNYVHA